MNKTLILFIISMVFTISATIAKTITFCNDPFPPYTTGEEGNAPTGGIATEAINAIFSEIEDVEVSMTLLPWKRCLVYVQTGKIDAVMSILKNEERMKLYDYTDHIITSSTVIYYNKNRNTTKPSWDHIKDLQPYQLGLLRGTKSTTYIKNLAEEHQVSLTTTEFNSTEQGFLMLKAGRIDLFPGEALTAKKYFAEKNLTGIYDAMEKPLYSSQTHIAFSKETEARKLIPKINEIINRMQSEKKFEMITDSYFK